MKKRFFAALLSLCLLVGLVPGMGTAAFAASQHNIGDTVEFAGHDWYIIGTESDGVKAPSGCYTLFAKNDDFGSTAFREDAGWEDATAAYYMDSDLQKKMKKVENDFSAEDKANIVARDTLDGIAGASPTGQLLWPLSQDEVEILDTSIQKFANRYLTRTSEDSIGYSHAMCVEMNWQTQTPIMAFYPVYVDNFSVRPALYVKAEALKGDDGREVELRNNGTYIQWRYAGEDDNAWRDLVALDAITGGDGADGADGADGREVELQVASGYIQWRYTTGADTAWKDLMSLSDLKGDSGEDGREVELQNNGTSIQWRYNGETEWKDLVALSDITGSDGTDGKQVELRVEDGYIQWKYDADSDWQNLIALSALQGIKGDKGDKGDPGEDGDTPYIGDNGNWWIGTTDTGIKASGTDGSNGSNGSDGKDGQDGKDGTDGLPPYVGSNGNWWIGTTDTGIKAAGTNGANGKNGTNGKNGADGVGIADIKLNENGELIITLTDGTENNLGKVKGEDGVGISGVSINENGELIVTLTNGTELNAGIVRTAETATAMGSTEISHLKTLVYVSVGIASVSLAGLIGLLAFLLTRRKSLIGK